MFENNTKEVSTELTRTSLIRVSVFHMSQHEPNESDEDSRTGQNLERLRRSKGWSQSQLAERMVEAGKANYRQTTVSRIERGVQPLRMSDMEALVTVFGADAKAIWNGPEKAAKWKRWIDEMIQRDARQLIEEKIENITSELSGLRELLDMHTGATKRIAGEEGSDDGEHHEAT